MKANITIYKLDTEEVQQTQFKHITKTMQHIACVTNEKVFALFLDLTSAFANVNRKWIFLMVRNRLLKGDKHSNVLTNLKNLNKHQNITMKEDSKVKLPFETTSAVPQGGSRSPLLFNPFIDYNLHIFFDKHKMKT